MRPEREYIEPRNERVDQEDTFLSAFGAKDKDRRRQRRQRKGWN